MASVLVDGNREREAAQAPQAATCSMATDMATDMNIRAFNEEGTSYLYINAHADSEPVRVAVADCLSALQQAPTMLLCPDSRKHVHELHMRHRRHETLCTLKSARQADEVQRRVILDNMVGKLVMATI